MTIETTLIIPAYKAEEYIINCLESVINQTLKRDMFEVLIVENGPRDSTAQIIKRVLGKIPDLNWRLIYEEFASLSNARNVGILEARGNWVTWVDVDDWLSPNFLEELTKSARDGVVPLARVVDVDETSGEQSNSPIATQILELEAGRHRPEMLWRSLGFAACKLLPLDQARRLKFDLELKSGEDVAYFSPFFSKWPQDFDTTPAYKGAVYYRLVRSGSMSRQGATFDFSVNQRLAVMKHLDTAATDAYPELRQIMHSMMRSQTLFSKRYLDENPKDADRVIEAFDAANLKYTPWNILSGKTSNLAILYNFAPFADASAVVAAKRIVSSGEQWNVINNDMSAIREIDTVLHTRIMPYISLQKTIKNPPIFGSWKGISDFCKDGLEAISEIEAKHGTQSRVYSRSMWPASHFLAALYKMQNPEIEWIAEFSDPLRKDVLGNERQGEVKDDEYWLQIESGVKSAGYQIGIHESIFAVCEKLAYALADSIYFTNAHQMTYMMSYLGDARLAERVSRISSIMPHPVPPSRFQPQTIHARSDSAAERVELGYFGSFYPNRGPGVILSALESLNVEFKNSIRLNIFSPNHSELTKELTSYISTGLVVVKPPLPYLDYLEAAKGMDVLLVADADTAASGHRLNPYLPSKLSDYIATGSRVWGLYESGSILSRSNVDYLSRCNDVSGAANVLERIVGGRK